MRGNDRLRTLWRGVAGPAPTRGVDFDALATRISMDGALALRARARWPRVAVAVGMAAVAVAVLAVSIMPTHRQATLLAAVSGGDAPAREFEVAVVGPRDGAWVIAAAIGADR